MIITDKLKNNIEIVNTYVDKYGCVPRDGTFYSEGGDLDYICSLFKSYENFIKELGFEDYGYRKLKKIRGSRYKKRKINLYWFPTRY